MCLIHTFLPAMIAKAGTGIVSVYMSVCVSNLKSGCGDMSSTR